MILSQRVGQLIVDEIEPLVQQNINIMNKEGKIVASTDAKRLGSTHLGAQKILNEKLDRLIITDEVTWENARPGINLPIEYNNEIVGVVGITGNYQDTIQIATLVKHFVEILLHENEQQNLKNSRNDAINAFLDEWREASKNNHLYPSIIAKGKRFGFDISRPYIVCLAEPFYTEEHLAMISSNVTAVPDIPSRLEQIMNRLKLKKYYVLKYYNRYIIFLQQESFIASTILTDFQTTFVNALPTPINQFIGVSSVRPTGASFGEIYEQAALALDISKREGAIVFYDNLTYELLLENLSFDQKEHYVNRVFGSLCHSDQSKFIDLIQNYVKNNGSLDQIGKDMFIHPNTVQYRINRFQEKTGFNLRNARDLVILFLASNIAKERSSRE